MPIPPHRGERGSPRRSDSWKVSTSQKLVLAEISPFPSQARPAGFAKRAEASSATPTKADPRAMARAEGLVFSGALVWPEMENPPHKPGTGRQAQRHAGHKKGLRNI